MMTKAELTIQRIDALRRSDSCVIVGIDGPAASGKTTLAAEVSAHFCCPTVHMDHFFLPEALRTQQRYDEPGGNIHYERFLEEVVCGVKSRKEFSYRVFNCSEGGYSGSVTIPPSDVVIIEGSYSLHPKWSDMYDLQVLLRVDESEQIERIKKRNGKEALNRFLNVWIPLERKYLQTLSREPELIL